MSSPTTVVKFDSAKRSKPKKTRYQDSYFTDRKTGRTHVLISAERYREMDVEILVERLSQRFLGKIRLMDDDQLALLEALATTVQWSSDDNLSRLERAAQRRTQRKVKR